MNGWIKISIYLVEVLKTTVQELNRSNKASLIQLQCKALVKRSILALTGLTRRAALLSLETGGLGVCVFSAPLALHAPSFYLPQLHFHPISEQIRSALTVRAPINTVSFSSLWSRLRIPLSVRTCAVRAAL